MLFALNLVKLSKNYTLSFTPEGWTNFAELYVTNR